MRAFEVLEQVEEDLVLHELDFEPDVPCGVLRDPCGRSAVFLIICRVCSATTPACVPCLSYLRSVFAVAASSRIFPECGTCRTRSRSSDEMWRVEPIGGA